MLKELLQNISDFFKSKPTPDDSVLGEKRLFFSYAVTISRAVDKKRDCDFLEPMGLSQDDYNALDEKSCNKINNECDIHNIETLKEALEDQGFKVYNKINDESLGIGLLFLGENSLPAFDHIFKFISEILYISVYDFTTMTYQGYCDGEHDTGSFSFDTENHMTSSPFSMSVLLKRRNQIRKLARASHVERINKLLSSLNDQNIVPEMPDLKQIPAWHVFGDCALRSKNELMPVEGIDVSFGEFSQSDDGEDDSDYESYTVDVLFKEQSLTFTAWLLDCQKSPRVNWDIIEDSYDTYIKDDLETDESDDLLHKFEEHVRQLFINSISECMRAEDDD